MPDRIEIHAGDPGRKWRRLTRLGAALCTLAIFFPFFNGRPIVADFGEIVDVAGGVRQPRDEPHFILIRAFCCLVLPALFCGPVHLVACSVVTVRLGKRGLRVALLMCLWIATVLTPYYFTFKQLPPRAPENEMLISIMISVLSVYLLVSGLAFLASWRVRKTPLFIFSFGLIALIATFVAWLVLLLASLAMSMAELQVFVVCALGVCGSTFMLVGWLKWWGAVNIAWVKPNKP